LIPSTMASLHLYRLHYSIGPMLFILLCELISALRSRRALAVGNLSFRHQLDVLNRNSRKPHLTNRDRALWVFLSRHWADWRESLTLIEPDTVIRWYRQRFRLVWKWKSRPRWPGRSKVPVDVRNLIRQMSRNNPLWGAPQIHGELLRLRITISQAAVSTYIVRHRKPPSQSWRTFLKNHARDIVPVNFFAVPTATFRVLFVFLVLTNELRRVVHFNVTDSPSAGWTGQQIVEAFPWDTALRYLLRDRNGVFGKDFVRRVESMGIKQVLISAR
jgi:putative transposase